MDRCELSDEELVQEVLNGNVDSFAEIVRRYQRKIVNMGMMFFRNRDDAWDFAQDVFLRAYEGLSTYKGKSKFYFWIYRIAYNHGINSTKGKVIPESLIEHMWEGDSPDERYEREEMRIALSKAITSLPIHYRVCVDLHFFYNLSYVEISKITGYPVNTVKSNVFRAKQVLRDALKELNVGDV
ncbi:MAG: sigma-70 family RNA polymerase sigma factor [Spirochaetes bacterium]|nr:sigma-70 family RNA polymerase sigma factor [Spirochaetota bacterium]